MEKPTPAEVFGASIELDNTERATLKKLLEPGFPLWKVLRSMEEYAAGLTYSIVNADLTLEEDLRAVKKIQATIQACVWAREVIEAAASPLEQEEQSNV